MECSNTGSAFGRQGSRDAPNQPQGPAERKAVTVAEQPAAITAVAQPPVSSKTAFKSASGTKQAKRLNDRGPSAEKVVCAGKESSVDCAIQEVSWA